METDFNLKWIWEGNRRKVITWSTLYKDSAEFSKYTFTPLKIKEVMSVADLRQSIIDKYLNFDFNDINEKDRLRKLISKTSQGFLYVWYRAFPELLYDILTLEYYGYKYCCNPWVDTNVCYSINNIKPILEEVIRTGDKKYLMLMMNNPSIELAERCIRDNFTNILDTIILCEDLKIKKYIVDNISDKILLERYLDILSKDKDWKLRHYIIERFKRKKDIEKGLTDKEIEVRELSVKYGTDEQRLTKINDVSRNVRRYIAMFGGNEVIKNLINDDDVEVQRIAITRITDKKILEEIISNNNDFKIVTLAKFRLVELSEIA